MYSQLCEDNFEGLQRLEPFDYEIWALIRATKVHSRTVLPIWFSTASCPLPCTSIDDMTSQSSEAVDRSGPIVLER